MKLLPSLQGLIYLISCFVLVALRSLIRVEFLILNPSARWRWPPFPDLTQPPLLTGDHPFSANHTASFQNGAVLLAKFEMMNLRLDCMICHIFNKLTSFQSRNSRKVHKKTKNCQKLWKMLKAKSPTIPTNLNAMQ